MLIAHNSNSGSGGGSSNDISAGSGSGGVIPDVQSGPHRKVLDGEGSGLRKDDGQIQNHQVDPPHKSKNNIISPTQKSAEADRYVKLWIYGINIKRK